MLSRKKAKNPKDFHLLMKDREMDKGVVIHLPANNKGLTLKIIHEVSPKDIRGIRRRLLRNMCQSHVCFIEPASALAMIAGRASRYHVRPGVFTAHVTRQNMVNRQPSITLSTVLAGIIIAAEDLTARQLHVRARAVHLAVESDD